MTGWLLSPQTLKIMVLSNIYLLFLAGLQVDRMALMRCARLRWSQMGLLVGLMSSEQLTGCWPSWDNPAFSSWPFTLQRISWGCCHDGEWIPRGGTSVLFCFILLAKASHMACPDAWGWETFYLLSGVLQSHIAKHMCCREEWRLRALFAMNLPQYISWAQ